MTRPGPWIRFSSSLNIFIAKLSYIKLKKPSKWWNRFLVKQRFYSCIMGPYIFWLIYIYICYVVGCLEIRLCEVLAGFSEVFWKITVRYCGGRGCWQFSCCQPSQEEHLGSLTLWSPRRAPCTLALNVTLIQGPSVTVAGPQLGYRSCKEQVGFVTSFHLSLVEIKTALDIILLWVGLNICSCLVKKEGVPNQREAWLAVPLSSLILVMYNYLHPSGVGPIHC